MKHTAVKPQPPRYEDASHSELARAIARDLRLVLRHVQAHSKMLEKTSGISEAQLMALRQIFASPGAKVSDLSKMLALHQSTTSNMLDKLQDKNLVKRERNGPDHRAVRLYLTSKGAQLLSQVPSQQQDFMTAAMSQMSDQELQSLRSGLGALLQHIELSVQESTSSAV